MIDIISVEKIQELLIEKFGGTLGVRDMGALEAAINRPFATFNQNELYPTPIEKAAAVLESLVCNHPFIDGNKRIGYVIARLLLLQSGIDIEANQEEKYNLVISVSKGEFRYDQKKEWLMKRHVILKQ